VFGNILVFLVLVAVAVFFGWLVTRALRSRRLAVKIPGVVLGGLFALVFAALAVVGAIGIVNVYLPGAAPAEALSVVSSPQQVERGAHLANSFCVECHSTTGEMPMTGGVDFAADIPIPLGSMVSANLTPSGVLKDYTDGELMRVFRSGVNRDGQRLAIMNSVNVRYMSDDDLHALIAFLRSQSPVENANPNPGDRLNYLAMVMMGAGMIPGNAPVQGPIVAPAKAPTAEYGAYVLSYQDCRVCHGEHYTGGAGGLAPVGPSLEAAKHWSAEQFMTTLRTGQTPDGRTLSEEMPWKAAGRMEDVELQAIHAYLQTLP
jgi:mono/diheme cytochrome c family protein